MDVVDIQIANLRSLIISWGNLMDKLKEFIDKYRSIILLISVLSSVWLFCAVLFIDVRWLLLLILYLPVISLTLYAYKDKVYIENQFGYSLRFIFGITTLLSFLIVLLCAIFVSAWWWFGLSIPLYTFIHFGSFIDKIPDSKLSKKNLKTLIYISLITFVLLIGVFFIPSFFANQSVIPNVTFSSQENGFPIVESYPIYFETGTKQNDREHVIARSWYEYSEGHYVNDYVNVIWSNQTANHSRGNREFKNIVQNAETEIKDGGNVVGYKDNIYFMPLDRYKGDVARIVLYMYVTYRNHGLPTNKIDIGLMKSWSAIDSVSQEEILRNNNIKSKYGYGNKFVDYPWLIVFII